MHQRAGVRGDDLKGSSAAKPFRQTSWRVCDNCRRVHSQSSKTCFVALDEVHLYDQRYAYPGLGIVTFFAKNLRVQRFFRALTDLDGSDFDATLIFGICASKHVDIAHGTRTQMKSSLFDMVSGPKERLNSLSIRVILPVKPLWPGTFPELSTLEGTIRCPASRRFRKWPRTCPYVKPVRYNGT